MKVEFTFCIKTFIALITGVAEHIREMLGLHMIPSQRFHLVGKNFTLSAVEPLVQRVSSQKLEQLIRVLEGET